MPGIRRRSGAAAANGTARRPRLGSASRCRENRPTRPSVTGIQAFRGLARRGLRPCDVRTARSVTRLAADVDLRPLGVVAVRWPRRSCGADRSNGTRAHEVPVLVAARRVQRVVGFVPVVPDRARTSASSPCPRRRSAPAAGRRGRQPGTAAAAPRRNVNFTSNSAGLPSRPSVVMKYLPSRCVNWRGHAAVREALVGEIAEHRAGIGRLHRALVVRPAPGLGRLGMAFAALRVGDVGSRRLRARTHPDRRRARPGRDGRPVVAHSSAERQPQRGRRVRQQRQARPRRGRGEAAADRGDAADSIACGSSMLTRRTNLGAVR